MPHLPDMPNLRAILAAQIYGFPVIPLALVIGLGSIVGAFVIARFVEAMLHTSSPLMLD
jgi:hypothetical protein